MLIPAAFFPTGELYKHGYIIWSLELSFQACKNNSI